MFKKRICALILLLFIVFSSLPCFANGGAEVVKQPYEYAAQAGMNGFGNFSVWGFFGSGSSLYYRSDSKKYTDRYVLVSVDTGKVILDNLELINNYSEYSDLIYYGMDGEYVLYDIFNNEKICYLGSTYGLGLSGHFGEEGGFFTLADGKLHYVKNDGTVGPAVNIDYAKYKRQGYDVSTWRYLGNNNFELVTHKTEWDSSTIGIINSSGKILLYANGVDVVYRKSGYYYIIARDGKYGIVDKNCNEIVPCIYDEIKSNSDGISFMATKDDIYYIIGSDGTITRKFVPDYSKYKAVYSYNGIYAVVDNCAQFYRYGIVDSNNKFILPCNYYNIFFDDEINDDLIGVSVYTSSISYMYGCLDRDSNIVIPFEYEYLSGFSEGLAAAEKDGKYGFIDKNNNVILPFIYEDASPFSEGLAAVEKDGKYGFIDKNSNVILPFIYEDAGRFSEGLAAAKKDGKYGFIDKSGNVIIPFMYEGAGSFENGKAYVWDENYYGMEINRQNEIVSDVDESFVPKYRLTSKIDPDASSYYEGGIEITSSGKVVDISNLNVWPVVLGTRGEYVLAFSPDFTNMYRLNITDNSPHTESTVKLNGSSINVDISLIGFDTSSTVVVGIYKGKTLVEHKTLKSTDSLKNIQFGSNCDTVKVMVWDSAENMSPLMYSESVPKSQWTDN